MFWHQTFEVWSWWLHVVELICFRSTKYYLQEFLDMKIISAGKWAVSERELCLKVEEIRNMSRQAGQEHNKQLTFGATVCVNSCQTSNGQQNMRCEAPH